MPGLVQELHRRQKVALNSSTKDLLLLRPFEDGDDHIVVHQTDAEHNRCRAQADSLRRSNGLAEHRPWYFISPEVSMAS